MKKITSYQSSQLLILVNAQNLCLFLALIVMFLLPLCRSCCRRSSGERRLQACSMPILLWVKGREAHAGETVTVHYTGTLIDGTKFDSSKDREPDLSSFRLGAGQVIKGWDEGVAGMKIGGTRKLVIPTGQLGYGAQRCRVRPFPRMPRSDF